MSYMFYGCESFNQDLNKWNICNVINMECMFVSCTNFNGDIRNWNIDNIEKNDLLRACHRFNQDLS